MKKILIFSTAYLPLMGGAEIAIKEITERAHSAQFDLICAKIKPGLPGFEQMERVNVYRLGWGVPFDKFVLLFWGFIFSVLLSLKNNYYCAWSMMASQASIAAALFKIFRPQTKLVLTLQEGDEEEHLKRYAGGNDFVFKKIILPLHLLVFKKADLITVISEHLKKRALRSGTRAPIEVIPNGVNVKKYDSGIRNQELRIKNQELREKLNIEADRKVVITVSRLVKKNGIGDLVEAIGQIKTEFPKIKLLILGSGELEAELKSKAEDLGLGDKILFLGDISNDLVPEYLAISDVFVRSSLSEGQGISFLEAMAAGVPVIGTPVGGIVDFLADGETGLLCQVNNPQNIAQKIKLLFLDDQLRQKLVDNARRLIEQKYDWQDISRRMEDVLIK